MIDIPRIKNYHDNSERTNANGEGNCPCIVCGRAINMDRPHWMVYVHGGGSVIVTETEHTEMNRANERGDLGCYPIGPECLRKHPDIKPYAIRVKPWEPDGVTSVPGFGSISL